ncbi:Hypothetical predicted protein [Scomber scombrus]|uniref:Uncharacterized protein n=1 Tax=Scomber scombrus TaxID=13677 RepID=A0AAV1Q5U2_SCOSC
MAEEGIEPVIDFVSAVRGGRGKTASLLFSTTVLYVGILLRDIVATKAAVKERLPLRHLDSGERNEWTCGRRSGFFEGR